MIAKPLLYLICVNYFLLGYFTFLFLLILYITDVKEKSSESTYYITIVGVYNIYFSINWSQRIYVQRADFVPWLHWQLVSLISAVLHAHLHYCKVRHCTLSKPYIMVILLHYQCDRLTCYLCSQDH